MNRYTSRKFWIAVVFQFVFVAMLSYGKMPADIFENLTYMLLGGYLVSNVTQKVLAPTTKEEVV